MEELAVLVVEHAAPARERRRAGLGPHVRIHGRWVEAPGDEDGQLLHLCVRSVLSVQLLDQSRHAGIHAASRGGGVQLYTLVRGSFSPLLSSFEAGLRPH